MSEQLKFFKGNENALDGITKIPGGIYHCQDTGNTYLAKDNGELELYSTTLSFSTDEAYDASVPLDANTLNGKTSNEIVEEAVREAAATATPPYVANNAGAHNATYRGKYLGDVITDA